MIARPYGSSGLEIFARQAEAHYRLSPFLEIVRRDNEAKLADLVTRAAFKIRRAPYAADTWQMLEDLGIEPAPRRARFAGPIRIDFSTRSVFR